MRGVYVAALTLGLIFFASAALCGQGHIRLLNPSFEFDSYNRPGVVPMFWSDFGSMHESPPDLQPGQFGCELPPFDGHSYVGLVTRDNGSREAIGQKLFEPLRCGQTYTISVALARSPRYLSHSRLTKELANFGAATVLEILGQSTHSALPVLLARSGPVAEGAWGKQNLLLEPPAFEVNWLVFRASNPVGSAGKNGNLLLDALSEITPVGAVERVQADFLGIGVDTLLEKQPISVPNPSFEKMVVGGADFEDWNFLQRNAPLPARCIEGITPPNGKVFLTLTTSGDGEFATVMCRLERPMRLGRAYEWSFRAAHCQPKRKPLRFAGEAIELADHKGCYLRIFGVDGKTGELGQLAFCGPFDKPDWRKITVELSPKKGDAHAIILQAWNDQAKTGRRTRSVFIDDLSPLTRSFNR